MIHLINLRCLLTHLKVFHSVRHMKMNDKNTHFDIFEVFERFSVIQIKNDLRME